MAKASQVPGDTVGDAVADACRPDWEIVDQLVSCMWCCAAAHIPANVTDATSPEASDALTPGCRGVAWLERFH
jgi:hypothetical protein